MALLQQQELGKLGAQLFPQLKGKELDRLLKVATLALQLQVAALGHQLGVYQLPWLAILGYFFSCFCFSACSSSSDRWTAGTAVSM